MNIEKKQLQDVLDFAYQIPGQTWPAEMGWLFHVLAPFKKHVEIGSYCGRSLYVTAAGMHLISGAGSHIWTVEPLGYSSDPGWDGRVLAATIAKIHRDFPTVKIHHVQGLSVDTFREFKVEYDSVFIDGCHEFAEVSADLQTWGNAARLFACGHDYWPNHWGVMDAVQKHATGFRVESGTRIWYIDKRLSE